MKLIFGLNCQLDDVDDTVLELVVMSLVVALLFSGVYKDDVVVDGDEMGETICEWGSSSSSLRDIRLANEVVDVLNDSEPVVVVGTDFGDCPPSSSSSSSP